MKVITVRAETRRKKEKGQPEDFRRRQAREKEQCAQHVWEAARAWGTDAAKAKTTPQAKCWRYEQSC